MVEQTVTGSGRTAHLQAHLHSNGMLLLHRATQFCSSTVVMDSRCASQAASLLHVGGSAALPRVHCCGQESNAGAAWHCAVQDAWYEMQYGGLLVGVLVEAFDGVPIDAQPAMQTTIAESVSRTMRRQLVTSQRYDA